VTGCQAELWSDGADRAGDGEILAQRPLAPLAIRMRPRSLAEIVGQDRILGPGCLLPRLVRQNSFGNLLLFGPPGCGKTSLAEAIAAETSATFIRLNAVLSNVAELRSVLQSARRSATPPILFIDEIHRFNRAQQDSLLPDVERGTIRLIGATTHTPTVYIISPLLSRSHLFQLEPLSFEQVRRYLRMALEDKERGLGSSGCTLDGEVLDALAETCDGDLRRALNALETLVMGSPTGAHLTLADWEAFGKERHLRYDRDESEHHATISAYIKSMRGCDPDAALYWLAKMLEGGEDPRFIARRLVIFASEDVGLADPHALPIAAACYGACETVGMPECAINLAHGTVHMATAQKSNSAYAALGRAQEEIRTKAVQPVPEFLRNQPKSLARRLGTETYVYAHGHGENVTGQRYMLDPKQFYFPTTIGAEKAIAERMERIRALRRGMSDINPG
jgi:putative ATPase